jgi:allantoinase
MKAGDFASAWGGIAGVQTLLAVLLDAGRLPLEAIAALTAAAPARRLRLPGKGRIEPGCDADLVLVDPGAPRTVLREEDLHDRHRANPFAGRALRGRVVRTIARGRTVYLDGRITATAGGRLLTPTPGERP